MYSQDNSIIASAITTSYCERYTKDSFDKYNTNNNE